MVKTALLLKLTYAEFQDVMRAVINEFARRSGVTAKELARLTGASEASYSYLKHGTRDVTMQMLWKISTYPGFRLDEIFALASRMFADKQREAILQRPPVLSPELKQAEKKRAERARRRDLSTRESDSPPDQDRTSKHTR